jgi:hypothetical protein
MSNIFVVGKHVFNVFVSGTGWGMSVDGVLVEGTFPTRSDAWEAGLAPLERADRLAEESRRRGSADEPRT